MEGIKKYYEEYHKVKISTDVIRQTVEMSEKYIHDRFLPDKAIDILDEACSRINLENKDLFKLEYQTRRDSAEFLKNIHSKFDERTKNIDFFHFANAYETISNFFAQMGINDRKNFIDTFLKIAKSCGMKHKKKKMMFLFA